MNLKGDPINFSKYGKSFQEKLCMVILDDRPFADQIEEVLDVNFLELNYLKLFLNKIFTYRKKYGVHPSRDIMKTILRSELDNENELTAKQTREFYVRSQITAVTDVEYIKEFFSELTIRTDKSNEERNEVKELTNDYNKFNRELTSKIEKMCDKFFGLNIDTDEEW